MEGTTRSVKRALEVLASICDRPDSSLSDVAAQTGMPLSTTHRILQTLMASGHLVRSSEGLYTAGPQTIWLGSRALANDSLRRLCQPTMTRLAQEIGESIYLSVRHGDSAQYIDAALGGAASQRLNWEGREFPLQTTAAGLALLGTIPECGFTMVDSSLEDDMTAIAAPVLLGGFPVAALSAVVLSEHLNNHTRQLWGSQIAREAQQLSADLVAAPSRRAPRSIETVRRRTA